jgi:c(7)-type cytochrome triheme protein
MRSLQFFLTLIITVAFAGSGFAVSPGKTVDYAGGSSGKVIFDGKTHADKGLKCTDCHTKVFPMKKDTKITMAEMNEGKYCGVCHNGQKAFKSSEQANCQKCHKK